MPHLSDRMLVLFRRRLREADAMLTFLGETEGKRRAKAPSLYKASNKLAGTLQPFNVVDVVLYARSEEQVVWTVTQASLVRHHAALQQDVVRFAVANCAVEPIDALTEEIEPMPELYRLMTKALEHWNRNSPTRLELMALHLRVLTLLGYSPSFDCCLRTGVRESSAWQFSAQAGGLVDAASASVHDRPLSPAVLAAFRHLTHGGKASTCHVEESDVRAMMDVLREHLEYHGAWRPKAWRVLEEVMS